MSDLEWKLRMKEMGEEDLVNFIRRGGMVSLVAAEEVLLREAFGEKGGYLREILEISKISPKDKEKAKKLKNKAAEIMIKKGFLVERNFLAIIDNLKSQDIKIRATIEYRSLTEIIPNHVLEQIIREVVSEKEWAANLLLEQTNDTNDLIVIYEEELTEGLQKRAWKKHRELGISIEDGLWLIGYREPLAYITWRAIQKQIRTKDVNEKARIYYEASEETGSQKVKEEALNKLWSIKKSLDREQLKHMETYAELITVERPKRVKEWIYEAFLKLPPLEYNGYEESGEYEYIKSIIYATKLLKIKERAIRRAIEEAKREIDSKKNTHSTRNIERIKYLKEEIIQLEEELQGLQKEIKRPLRRLSRERK